MARVNLPPGCLGFKAQDGTRYVAKPGTHVEVADHHLAALAKNDYAQAGLVDAGPEKFFTVRRNDGRWCRQCHRLWNSWNLACPKCDRETIAETEMDRTLPAGQYQP